jgi:TonB family protein
MFEKMVLSGAGRRDRRLSKFFVGSTLVYLLLAGSALAVSICVSDPKLLGAGGKNAPPFIIAIQPSGGGHPPTVARAATTARQNIYSPSPLVDILRHASAPQPPQPIILDPNVHGDGPGFGGPGVGGPGNGIGNPLAIGTGDGLGDGAPPPQSAAARKPSQPVEVQRPRDNGPVKVSQPVLQGKAIYRKTPEYPAVAKIVKKEGPVVVEVVISPEGLVESARAISGDPLLAPTAVAAAREWRFQPTYLGNVPVRVAGAITFVFKLGQ